MAAERSSHRAGSTLLVGARLDDLAAGLMGLIMSRLLAGCVVLVLLSALPHSAPAAPAAPGSVDPVPAAQAPAPPPPTPAPTPAPPSQTETPPVTAPAAAPPANETAPAKTEAKKPSKRRAARHRHYGYRYGRDPFLYAHPRFWWPFYRHRYRAYRYPRRHYYRPAPFPFYGFRW
jgi:pyruvate/2-oxoglutarate dehydrogenase complex dihydrolipoamide acyltransferase (E2) component